VTPGPGDQARVSVTVHVAPQAAFDLFTGEIDRWWRRGRKYRHLSVSGGIMHLESGLGGRVFESCDVDGQTRLFEVGRVITWDPPRGVAFTWRNANFNAEQSTEVEVRFEAVSGGTLVTVVHRGWSSLPADHPARHGLPAAQFVRMIGLWWGDQMSSLRRCAEPSSE
jgi:uncharacterized protein YndB with AHSA1/START domain